MFVGLSVGTIQKVNLYEKVSGVMGRGTGTAGGLCGGQYQLSVAFVIAVSAQHLAFCINRRLSI